MGREFFIIIGYNVCCPRGCIALTWRARSHLQVVFGQRRKIRPNFKC